MNICHPSQIFRKDREKADNMDGMSPTSSPESVENNKEQCNTNRNTKTCYIIENENKWLQNRTIPKIPSFPQDVKTDAVDFVCGVCFILHL